MPRSWQIHTKRFFMKILLQFPEGLKSKALEYSSQLEKEGNTVFVSASPTYGACDLAIDEAKALGVDKLVHYGHAEFHHVDFNVEYVFYSVEAPTAILERSLEYLKDFKTISIVTTIQHVQQIGDIKKFYESRGKSVVIGKPYGFAKHQGQILGCDIGSAASVDKKVDAHVYFGGGIFHPLGAVIHTAKPFLAVEPFTNTIEFMDHYREKHRRRKMGRIAAAAESRKFGILVSTKNGQHNLSLAKLIKEKVEKKGLSAAILVSNNIDFQSLDNMLEFDAFVNTACPRIAVDDNDRVRKPLLSANELMEVLSFR